VQKTGWECELFQANSEDSEPKKTEAFAR